MMAWKKKKKEGLDASLMGSFVPGAMPTPSTSNPNFALILWNLRNYAQVIDLVLAESDVRPVYQIPHEHQTTMARAWVEYTGIPSIIGGGLGALGFQAVAQSPQAYGGWRAGMYGSLLFAFASEMIIGTFITASILTITDPAHKYSGGTDELMRGQVHPTTSKDIIMGLGSWGAVV
jgi:hypothetical protein